MENMIFLKSLLDEYINECRGNKNSKDIQTLERALEIISSDALGEEMNIRLHGYE